MQNKLSPEMQTLLNALEQQGINNDAQQQDRNFKYLNITRDTGEFLYWLVKSCQVERILELGTSNGYSTLWFAAALPEGGKIFTIERSEHKVAEAMANFKRVGVEHSIDILVGDVLEQIYHAPQEIDLVFMDTQRSVYPQLIEPVLARLKPGGVIVVDNAISHANEIQTFVDYFEQRDEFTTSLLTVGKGEYLIYKSV
ncbi:O-methyltransferase [Vibrio fluvialis]|nr:O-methyltransferase [Vibrio fluvialis]